MESGIVGAVRSRSLRRNDLIRAAMAAGGSDARYAPAQIQKLLFLLDREVAGPLNGPFFAFKPYDYGPFDRAVYDELEQLQLLGHVAIDRSGRYREYSLSGQGFKLGEETLGTLESSVRSFLEQAARWVRVVSFNQLVSTIYQHYPDMKTNSVFQS